MVEHHIDQVVAELGSVSAVEVVAQPDHGGEHAECHQDPADQDELVVRAELTDGEVLQPGRREVDLQLADHHHR